mmetsp:Transcript_7035/g.18220  ORF Transcript_7035/g.18220 Transcript_7035/m.18220 type:complete len:103 (+) Transcript_7035:124-432(+)
MHAGRSSSSVNFGFRAAAVLAHSQRHDPAPAKHPLSNRNRLKTDAQAFVPWEMDLSCADSRLRAIDQEAYKRLTMSQNLVKSCIPGIELYAISSAHSALSIE